MASSELIDHTLRFWQERSGAPVSPEDARQMVENASGFFTLLVQWNARDREPGQPADHKESWE